MRKIFRFFIDYFSFSRSEQRGIIILSAIIICLMAIQILLPGHKTVDPDEFLQFMNEVDAFVEEVNKIEDSIRSVKVNHAEGFRPEERTVSRAYLPEPKAERQPEIIELNDADSSEMETLPGIGPVFARRIVKYRDLLGGYVNTGQLLEVYGMDTIRVDTSLVKRLSLNQASFKQLVRHPYFPYETVKVLMKYRDSHERFDSIGEILLVDGIPEQTFRKIIPYLALD
jgi:competence protein ComEA